MNHYEYFSDIEATFIRRRGRNLFLSPKDWALMDGWQKQGIPLHIVIRSIEAVFDKKPGAVASLAYCAPAVEADYKNWLSGQVGARTEAPVVENAPCVICGDPYCLKLHQEELLAQGRDIFFS